MIYNLGSQNAFTMTRANNLITIYLRNYTDLAEYQCQTPHHNIAWGTNRTFI